MERKGICGNKGPCSMANRDAIQIINDDASFVCAECGEELKPYKEEKGKKTKDGDTNEKGKGKLIAIIGAAVLLLGGLGYGGYAFYHSYQENEQEKAALQKQAAENAKALRQKEIEDSIKAAEAAAVEVANEAEKIRRDAAVADAQAKGDSIIKANEKLLDEKGKKIRTDAKSIIEAQITSLRIASETLQYENIPLIDTMEVAINEAWKNAEKPVQVGEGPNPSWGRYQGTRKNGKPDGTGVLYITRSTTINGETASPGERIEGVFRDGYVNMGTWYKNDGNTVVVKDFKVI